MLGAIMTLVLLGAAAFAVTQVGGVITLLFIAAVLFLAYRRLSLLTFTLHLHGAAGGLHLLRCLRRTGRTVEGLPVAAAGGAVAAERAPAAQGADQRARS